MYGTYTNLECLGGQTFGHRRVGRHGGSGEHLDHLRSHQDRRLYGGARDS